MDLPEDQEKHFWEEYRKLEEEEQMPFVDIFERKALAMGMGGA